MTKFPAAGFQFIDRVIGFDVLGHVVKLNVPGGGRNLRIFVVLDMIGAEASVFVEKIDVAVGVIDAADLALLVRFETGVLIAARAGNKGSRCDSWRRLGRGVALGLGLD